VTIRRDFRPRDSNGLPHGVWKTYRHRGWFKEILLLEETFVHGERTGFRKLWYPDGSLWRSRFLLNGEYEGERVNFEK
jgi:antitoxin component YwqK of YwqJK toxin-antitoxin module